ncbi:MAG: CHAT domain-containing protein [Rivularia sp. (in: cyanobacteria)]
MKYKRKEFRKLIRDLTVAEFDESLDDFPDVREQFTRGMSTADKNEIILNYFEKHQEEFPQLLAAIRECNGKAYQDYVSQLDNSEKPETKSSPSDDISEDKTCDILVLAANAISTNLLQLQQEADQIRLRLQEGEVGKNYIVKVETAARVEELSKYLLQYKPRILHFSSHGNSSGEIILYNSQEQPQPVSPEALAELLAVVRGRIECVVLNACFSLEKADAIVKQVSCVVGMSKEIGDRSAVTFAAGFYRGLGFGGGYYSAFELGCNEIKLLNLSYCHIVMYHISSLVMHRCSKQRWNKK